MNKDVIYIDVDDDITAIIGKIKESKEKIVALVPPKHVGVLQSAVNLRLLDRMAKTAKKNLVVVTNNQGLIALAASARIPVAKNLQSKPEIADIPALIVDDGEDIIDGADLPVGDHADSTDAKQAHSAKEKSSRAIATAGLQRHPTRDDAVETLAIEEEPLEPAGAIAAAASKKASKGTKIPNFNKFRKRLFLGILAAIVLIGVLIWAFVFAPAATVTITADTTPEQVSGTVKLGGTAATDYSAGVITSEMQTLQKNATVQFTPTGQQDNGQKATGTVTFSTDSFSALGTIPAGTKLTSTNGSVFTTDQDVTLTATNHAGASTTMTAAANGEGSNGATGTMSGAPSGVTAKISGGATAGGTSDIITIVSDSDIQDALAQITGQSTDAAKKAVEAQFPSGEVVIDSSFASSQGTPVSSPASGQPLPAGQTQATLTVPMTYIVYAFPKTAIDSYLTANLTSQLSNTKNQRIYDNGDSKVGFSNFVKNSDGTMDVDLTTTGQIGPQIDETSVKNSIKGEVTGSVQSTLDAINGVDNVDVSYSYFWVHKIPSNINKITIEFKLTNG